MDIPSPARAKAFLWLLFHYLEDRQTPNPFADEYARQNPGRVPFLPRLSPDQMPPENVDPPEEIELGNRKCAQRTNFLKKLVNTIEPDKQGKDAFRGQGCCFL